MSACVDSSNPAEDLLPKRPKHDRKSKICVKCKEAPGNIVIRHAIHCKACFLSLVSTKFRRALEPCINDLGLGSSKISKKFLKAPGDLLIAFSGGLGSTVLLDLIFKYYFQGKQNGTAAVNDNESLKGGTAHPRNEKAWQRAIVCYIDCSATGCRDETKEIVAVVNRYKVFEFVSLKLEDAFDTKCWIDIGDASHELIGVDLRDEELSVAPFSSSCSPGHCLQTYLNSLPSSSAIPASITTLKRCLLQYTAARNGCSHLVLGNSMTSTGIDMIHNLSTGGGVSEFHAGAVWAPTDGDQRIVHVSWPLRDIGLKECAAYVWWCNLEVVDAQLVGPDVAVNTQGTVSVEALTRAFITNLEHDYPSTVSAIVKTCAKVEPKWLSFEGDLEDFTTTEDRCVLCQRSTQTGVSQKWRNQISITTLPQVSDVPTAALNLRTALVDVICYACNTTLCSVGGKNKRGNTFPSSGAVPMPVWVNIGLL